MNNDYVALHRHDSFSFYDGLDVAFRASPYAKNLGHPAMGLTNHGNVYGLVDHHRQCTEAGIKPIHGAELYLTESVEKPVKDEEGRMPFYHQTVLVQNAEGYRNLMRLVTKSHELFYYKPRITLELLEEYGEGLIVLSGCPSSMLQRMLQKGDAEGARALFKRMKASFGDRFYAELQHHPSARGSAKWLCEVAARYGVPVVATNDAHYVEADDKPVHDFVLATRKKGKGEENPTYGDGFHVLSRKEAYGYLREAHPWMSKSQASAALDETCRIAERVDFQFEKPKRMLPKLWGDNSDKLLRRYAIEGLKSRGLDRKKEYLLRLKREFGVIEQLGYVDYFHVVREATTWAREHDILVGPRGSVCGSLVAFVLGVTTIDPIVHGTLFERFLHEQKTSVPDVDIDVDSQHRDKLHAWIFERFKPYVYPIIAFGRAGPGMVARDLQAVLPNIEPGLWEDLKDDLNYMKYTERIEVPTEEDLRKFAPDTLKAIEADAPWVVRCLTRLVGAVRYVGKHPGGVCFVPEDAMNWIALVRRTAGEEQLYTCYSHLDIVNLGLVKYDFLGLNAMNMVSSTFKAIKKRHGETLTVADIPLDSGKVYAEFSRGNSDGIFQFETPGAKGILKEIEPDVFHELVAATALNRPGVSQNLEAYVEGKRHAVHEGPYAETYGVLVYQEQIAQSLRAIGLDWRDTDLFLKSIKSISVGYNSALRIMTGVDIHEKIKGILRNEKGYTKQQADDFISEINHYSFNKGHAVGYTLTGYVMMWLRIHYPLEFWMAVLNGEEHEIKRHAYERAAIYDHIVLLPPHVNGTLHYAIRGNAIRVGLRTVKDVGELSAAAIIKGGPYERAKDIRQLPKRAANSKVIKALIAAGALIMDPEKWKAHAVAYNVMRTEQKLGGWQYHGKVKGQHG